jgi:hypothetical protein
MRSTAASHKTRLAATHPCILCLASVPGKRACATMWAAPPCTRHGSGARHRQRTCTQASRAARRAAAARTRRARLRPGSLQVRAVTTGKAAFVKACFSIRGALQLMDYEDPSIVDVKRLILRSAFSAAFLARPEGCKFISSLFTLHPQVTRDLTCIVKNQVRRPAAQPASQPPSRVPTIPPCHRFTAAVASVVAMLCLRARTLSLSLALQPCMRCGGGGGGRCAASVRALLLLCMDLVPCCSERSGAAAITDAPGGCDTAGARRQQEGAAELWQHPVQSLEGRHGALPQGAGEQHPGALLLLLPPCSATLRPVCAVSIMLEHCTSPLLCPPCLHCSPAQAQ